MLPYLADFFPTAALTSEFPSLTNAPTLLRSMNAQPLFEQGQPGKPSQNFAALLERIQSADPTSPDFDEDNKGQGWGHYQFTAGGLNLSSSLTEWQDVGSIAFAFQLVAAAIKTCRDARLMCANAGKSTVVGFISDAFLQETLDALKRCWIGAGGVSACGFIRCFHPFTILDNGLRVFSSRPTPFYSTYILRGCKVTSAQTHCQTQAAVYPRRFQRSHSQFYRSPAAHRQHAGPFY